MLTEASVEKSATPPVFSPFKIGEAFDIFTIKKSRGLVTFYHNNTQIVA
jgi:hypothetical protein